MAHVAREMQRARLTHAAADRRRDDVARAHGGEDRAALRRPDGLRARRVARGRRGSEPAVRRPSARRTSREVDADYETIRAQHAGKKRPELVTLAAARANAFADGLAGVRAAGADVHRPARLQERRSRRARAAHRLGAVLPGMGAVAGRFRRSSTIRSSAKRRATLLADGQAMLAQIVEGRWLTADGVVGLWPAASRRRRHRDLRPTNARRRRC